MSSNVGYERIVIARGERSGHSIAVALHSTALGAALGGCRVWQYPSWRDGLEDALRLSAAMTVKCAAAGLPTGGGKTVIALPLGSALLPEERRSVFLDLGDVVESLGGRYRTAEDVGTSTVDMHVVRERTAYVLGLNAEPAAPTAQGVFAALEATVSHLGGKGRDVPPDLEGRRVTISGLGQVGSRLARRLTERGAILTVTDVAEGRKALADELGARWVSPAEALIVPAEVFVPAGVGGLLTSEVIDGLDARAVVGPANNQLAEPAATSASRPAGSSGCRTSSRTPAVLCR
jgi:leucine dehydrogenase